MQQGMMPSSFGPGQGAQAPKQSELEAKIQKAIAEDPEIIEASKISVYLKKGGLFRKTEIHLIGKVSSDLDKKRAQQLAEYNISKKIVLVNDIKVEAKKK